MSNKILLCADLDRTILPNGPQEESPQARPLLRKLAARPELTLAYVSGRHKDLLIEAINDYQIPTPDYAIGDVGTTIYEIVDKNDNWSPWEAWSKEIAPDWRETDHDALATLLSGIDELQLQEAEKQNTFKLSYYAPQESDRDVLLNTIQKRLETKRVHASLIWSIDDLKHIGLLDVLPARATKLHAIRFLMQEKGFSLQDTVFAGDSGNDLPVLTSEIQAILVRNARSDVRKEAVAMAKTAGLPHRLYLAKGGFLDMNGNYSAGVLEGLAHYLPQTITWLHE